jgi:hypothetical protein
LGLLAVATGTAGSQFSLTSTDTSLPSLTTRFLSRPVEPLTQFLAMRHLEATNSRFKKHAWMDAVTELSPDGTFTFRVLAEGGSEYIRRKVLRPILEGEQEIVARGETARSTLTLENYDITGEGPAEPGLVRLIVKPKRQERTLIDGAVFVTDTDAELVRVTGRLARNPSFWTQRVEVIRRYGRVAGIRVPLSVESVAHVRIAGPSAMTMVYQYEMVNGHPVNEQEIADAR